MIKHYKVKIVMDFKMNLYFHLSFDFKYSLFQK